MKIEGLGAFVRLDGALGRGLLELPAGRAVLLRPFGDVGGLFTPQNSVIFQSFFPAFRAYQQAGYTTLSESEALKRALAGAECVVICLSAARALNEEMIAHTLEGVRDGAMIIVEGAKKHGSMPLLQKARALGFAPESWAKSHGLVFWFAKQGQGTPEKTDARWPLPPQKAPEGAESGAGLFSAEHPDLGSRLLGAHLKELAGKVCDLGAGWGYLSQIIARAPAVKEIHLIEAEKRALDASRKNLRDERARFFWADALDLGETPHAIGQYDYVVSNPPFHQFGTLNIELGRGFIRASARLLKRDGHFYMVANRHLPYEKTLRTEFDETVELEAREGYKIIKASLPRRENGA